MALKWSKLQVPRMDPRTLKRGIWGNTWLNWGQILAAFLALYAVEAGYFTGLLFAAKAIRGDDYRKLPDKWFGYFDSVNIAINYPLSVDQPTSFNRPQGCLDMQESVSVRGQTYQRPTGIQSCSTGRDGNQWVLFPWTLDTNNLGQFPGCSNPTGASQTLSTFLSKPTSPAYYGNDVKAPPALVQEYVCQNFALDPVA